MSTKRYSIETLLTGDSTDLRAELARGGKALVDFDKAIDRPRKSSNHLKREADGLKTSISSLLGPIVALTGGFSAWQSLRGADEFKLLDSRIQLATASTGDYVEVSQELYDITQANGQAFADSVQLFQRVAMSAPDLGATNGQVLELVDTVQKLGVVSGASQEEMKDATRQLSQSLSAQVMRAEEFNSVIEHTPAIAQAIADGMNMTKGELRETMLAGELLSKDVFEALLSQAEKANAEFAAMPLSMERAGTMLDNSWKAVVFRLDDAVAATDLISSSMAGLSGWLDGLDAQELTDLADTATVAGTALGGLMIARSVGPALNEMGRESLAATAALNKQVKASVDSAKAAHQEALEKVALARKTRDLNEVRLIEAKRAAETATGFVRIQRAAGDLGPAQQRLAASNLALEKAQQAATLSSNSLSAAMQRSSIATKTATVAANTARSAFSLIGGPGGVALLAAGALATWALSAEDAHRPTQELASEIDSLSSSYQDMGKELLKVTQHKVVDNITEQKLAIADLEKQMSQYHEVMQYSSTKSKAYENAEKSLKRLIDEKALAVKELGDAEFLQIDIEDRLIDLTNASTESLVSNKDALSGKTEEQQKLLDSYEKGRVAQEKFNGEVAEFKKLLDAGEISQERYNKLVKAARNELDKATGATKARTKATKASTVADKEQEKALSDVEKTLNDLIDELYPAEKATREYEQAAYDLNLAVMEGLITEEEMIAVLNRKQQSLNETADKAKESAEKVKQEADPMAQAWERGLERIDDSFADAFRNGFDNFEDFGDSLVDSFKDTLAELAYQLAKSEFLEMLGGTGWGSNLMSSMGVALPGASGSTPATGDLSTVATPGMPPAMQQVAIAYMGYEMNKLIGTKLGSWIDAGKSAEYGEKYAWLGGSVLPSIVGALSKGDWQTTGAGIQASNWGYNGDVEAIARSYTLQKRDGGWLHSDDRRTQYGENDSELARYIDQTMEGFTDVVMQIGENLGSGVNWQGGTGSFTLDTVGLSAEEIAQALDDKMRDIAANWIGTVVPEFEGMLELAGDSVGDLLEPISNISSFVNMDLAADVQSILEAQSQTLTETANIQLDALSAAMFNVEGSISGMQDLSMISTQITELGRTVSLQIEAVRSSADTMFDSLNDMVWKDTHSAGELFEKYGGSLFDTMQDLQETTDPEKLNDLMGQFSTDFRAGWSMIQNDMASIWPGIKDSFLDESGNIIENWSDWSQEAQADIQKQYIDQYSAYLESAEAITQQSLDTAQRDMEQRVIQLQEQAGQELQRAAQEQMSVVLEQQRLVAAQEEQLRQQRADRRAQDDYWQAIQFDGGA